MYNQESALANIMLCIDRINEQLPLDQRIVKDKETLLFGAGSTLDSLSLINLIVEVEELVSLTLGKRISVLEAALMNADSAQFSSVGDLAKWIAESTS